MKNKILIVSLLGCLSVAFGALGAHALKEILNSSELQSYLTAVRYQMIHTLYMLALISLKDKMRVQTPFYLALAGIILFSGSIYLLVLDEYMDMNLAFLGPVTPLGGLVLITSWLTLGIINVRKFK